MPLVLDAATSLRAVARSGPIQAPEGPGSAVNGQYGRWPGMPGGRIWQVGVASAGPPSATARRLRSAARLNARRTRGSLKGATRVLNPVNTMSGSALMCTRLGNLALSPAAPGSGSLVQSACPASISAVSWAVETPEVHTMRSGDPAGWAAADHSRKYRLRENTTWRPGI